MRERGGLVVNIERDGMLLLSSARWSLDSVPLHTELGHLDMRRYVVQLWPADPADAARALSAVTGDRQADRDVTLQICIGDRAVRDVEGELVTSYLAHDRLAVLLDGPPMDALALQLLQGFLDGVPAAGWRLFRDESARESWLDACLMFQTEMTPWTGVGDQTQLGADCPLQGQTIEVSLSPADFPDHAGLFCLLGEKLLGRGGYAGKGLDGLAEVLAVFASRSITVDVALVELAALRTKMAGFAGLEDFFDALISVFDARGVAVSTTSA